MTQLDPAPFLDDIAYGPEGGAACWVKTSDEVKIRVGYWPLKNAKGTVLLFPGRTEFIEKYGQAAAALAARGFASVAIDWRGQGMAERLLADPLVGHVNHFPDYQKDVAAMIRAVRRNGIGSRIYGTHNCGRHGFLDRAGESAEDAVIPGVLSLVDQGFVDADKIGVQGHSWGGYQISHMITRSDIFAAAEAGAPVVNMTSAYGGIRWASGMSRAFQYERTQSRIGGTLWDSHQKFIENSPLFFVDKIFSSASRPASHGS